MSNILITKAFCSTAVGSAKFVLIVLADAANSDSQTWQGLDTLAAKTGLSKSAIKNAMVRLVEDKHISVDRRYNRTNIYTIHPVECPKLKELLLEKPTLAARESLLDQIFAEISGKKKSLAECGKKLMSQNLAHQNSGLMSQNLAHDEPESSPSMSQILANNPKVSLNIPKNWESKDSLVFSNLEKVKVQRSKDATNDPNTNPAIIKRWRLVDYLKNRQHHELPAIDENHQIFVRANKLGIPAHFMELAWFYFKSNHEQKVSFNADWPGVFEKMVLDGADGLFFPDPNTGEYKLTVKGLNVEARMNYSKKGVNGDE